VQLARLKVSVASAVGKAEGVYVSAVSKTEEVSPMQLARLRESPVSAVGKTEGVCRQSSWQD
jgi:hypothetical protein